MDSHDKLELSKYTLDTFHSVAKWKYLCESFPLLVELISVTTLRTYQLIIFLSIIYLIEIITRVVYHESFTG